MATLGKCMECGGLASSQASRCPRCSTRYPGGVKCTVCCQTLKRSEALKISKDYGEIGLSTSVKFFHYSCHQQVSQVRMGRSRTSCPVCLQSIEFDTSSSVNCSNCGQKFSTHFKNPSFAPCFYCGFLLNKNLEVAIKDVNRQFLDGYVTETLYAHKVCYTQDRQDKEKIQQKKEKFEQARANRQNYQNRRQKHRSDKIRETLAMSLILGLGVGLIVGGLGGGISHFAFGFGYNWKNAALLGFSGVSILTGIAVGIFNLFE